MGADNSKDDQDTIAVVTGAKPKVVTYAVRILYTSVALSGVIFYLEWAIFQNAQVDFFAMFFFAFICCWLTLWWIYKID
jgi:hypothetical protein